MERTIFVLIFSTFSFFGCRAFHSESDLLVTNSKQEVSGYFGSVFRIVGELPDEDDLFGCGATAVGPNTAITAGHCVRQNNRELLNIRIFDGDEGLAGKQPIEVLPHPKYLQINNFYINDVAVLIFEGSPFRRAYISFGRQPPELSQKVVIVGYGRKDHDEVESGGDRQYGINEVSSISSVASKNKINFLGQPRYIGNSEEGEQIYVDYRETERHIQAGINVGASYGDSGGPMLFNGLVVGIASSIDIKLSQEGMIHAHYENLNGPDVIGFLRNTHANGAYISGLHPNPKGGRGYERRRLITPIDLEDALIERSYEEKEGRDQLNLHCVCRQTTNDCRLLIVDNAINKNIELAKDAAEACGDGNIEACARNFLQYKSICRTITIN